ncbi:MAG: hypothetical protein KIS76_07270 [Pyrinomonadaceae bacterium]|nr:hypothetical protein [Pyrinomonadaceae bacterium]
MPVPFEDQESVLKDVCRRFESLEIPYMLSGSMAMVSYAIMRMTNDIDIVIDASAGDDKKIVKEFQSDYYLADIRVRNAVERRRMFNMLHLTKIVKVDCVILKNDEFQQTAFANRRRIKFTDFDIWIVNRDDLILSKLNWAKPSRSEMQLRDVANIIRNGFDRTYVESWAEKLGVSELLQECYTLLDQNYVDGHDT